jgi:hypothetical protein
MDARKPNAGPELDAPKTPKWVYVFVVAGSLVALVSICFVLLASHLPNTAISEFVDRVEGRKPLPALPPQVPFAQATIADMESFQQREQRAIDSHGATEAEWVVLLTAGYYIPLPKDRFIPQAAWEGRSGRSEQREGDVSEQQIAEAIDSCLLKGWVRLTEEGHVEHERNVLGSHTGETTEYPKDGIALTEAGHRIHSGIAIAIHGRDYYSSESASERSD